MLHPPEDAPQVVQTIHLQGAGEAKRDKLRVPFDLRPDPEGNEFCVLHRDPR